jgi:YVTN family beta-propeller protein/cysteine-rich repeat protein
VGESFPGFRDRLIVSDTGTNLTTGSLTIGSSCFMRGLTLNASGSTLYATCGNLGQLLVVDTASLTYTPVTVGFVPAATSLTPDGAFVYVTNAAGNSVSVVDTTTNTVVDTVTVGDEPSSYGQFIGPDFVCGNGVLEPGEGCDDGNLVDGDGCNPDCYAVHDSVVVPAKPLKLKIGAGETMVTKDVKGVVTVGAFASSMFQLNYKAAIRCTFTLTASNPADFSTSTRTLPTTSPASR